MRSCLLLALAIAVCGAVPSSRLPRGDEHFRLGMSRAQVDSAITARGLSVISNGTAFLVCASGDSTAEYEQYSFFQAPHGLEILWKVTVGYHIDASREDYAAVRQHLLNALGEPNVDSWNAVGGDDGGPANAQRAVWADDLTAVQIGARWTDAPDPNADRMKVTWADLRLQRLVEARRKKGKDKVPPPK